MYFGHKHCVSQRLLSSFVEEKLATGLTLLPLNVCLLHSHDGTFLPARPAFTSAKPTLTAAFEALFACVWNQENSCDEHMGRSGLRVMLYAFPSPRINMGKESEPSECFRLSSSLALFKAFCQSQYNCLPVFSGHDMILHRWSRGAVTQG